MQIRLLALMLLAACGSDPAIPRTGPIYVVFDTEDLRIGIQVVLDEFNAQMGRPFFTTATGAVDDLLVFVQLPSGATMTDPDGAHPIGVAVDPHLIEFPAVIGLGDNVLFYDLVTHEIGHTMGLGHNEDVGDVMTPGLRQRIPLETAVSQVIAAARLH